MYSAQGGQKRVQVPWELHMVVSYPEDAENRTEQSVLLTDEPYFYITSFQLFDILQTQDYGLMYMSFQNS